MSVSEHVGLDYVENGARVVAFGDVQVGAGVRGSGCQTESTGVEHHSRMDWIALDCRDALEPGLLERSLSWLWRVENVVDEHDLRLGATDDLGSCKPVGCRSGQGEVVPIVDDEAEGFDDDGVVVDMAKRIGG